MDNSLLDALNSLGSSLWGVAGNVASASVAAAQNRDLQKMVYNQQSELSDKTFWQNNAFAQQQRQWNLEDYDRIMRDTSPSAAVQRFKDAGMSTAGAVMSAGDVQPQINSVGLPQMSTPSAPSAPYGSWDKLDFDILGALRQAMAFRKEKVEAENAEATQISDIRGILDDNEAKGVSLQMQREALRYAIETNPYMSQSIRFKMLSDQYLPASTKLAYETARVNYKSANEQYGFIRKFHKKQLKSAQEEINNLIKEGHRIEQETATSKSQEDLNRANAGVAAATTENIKEDTGVKKEDRKSKVLQNYGLVVENALKKYGCPEDGAQKIAALVNEGLLPFDKVAKYLQKVRKYVETGKDTFMDDKDLRSLFVHQIVPGIGTSDKLSIWNMGTYNESRRGFENGEDYLPSWLKPFLRFNVVPRDK